jgi:hypothetical protein
MPTTSPANEPHAWDDKTPEQVLDALVYELYTPVSALGDEIDRLSSGAFVDDELLTLLGQLRAGVSHLSRIVVALKRYTSEHGTGEEQLPEAVEP